MLGLGNTYDRWLFGFTPRNGETIANTHWWAIVLGVVAGLVGAVKSLIANNPDPVAFSMSIAGGIVFVLAVVYAFKNVPRFSGVAKKILRVVYIMVVCSIWFSFGYFVGMVVGLFVIAVLILWFFIKVLFAMLGSEGSSTSSSSQPKKRYTLDDGTKVEEIGNDIYEDVAGYTRYRKGTFTDEFEKIN